MFHKGSVGAIVLAAGQSRRMGQPKMILPWGDTTVIGQVVRTLCSAAISPIIVVTGGAETLVTAAVRNFPVSTVSNPLYAQGEMLISLQTGLRAVPSDLPAVLVCLGDQPQMEKSVVAGVVARYQDSGSPLVVPSYQMHRGHPWLVARELWDELLDMDYDSNLRVFLNSHREDICYLNTEQASILMDLDTPDDYRTGAPVTG